MFCFLFCVFAFGALSAVWNDMKKRSWMHDVHATPYTLLICWPLCMSLLMICSDVKGSTLHSLTFCEGSRLEAPQTRPICGRTGLMVSPPWHPSLPQSVTVCCTVSVALFLSQQNISAHLLFHCIWLYCFVCQGYWFFFTIFTNNNDYFLQILIASWCQKVLLYSSIFLRESQLWLTCIYFMFCLKPSVSIKTAACEHTTFR